MPRPRQNDGRVHGVVVACRRTDGRWLCIRRSKTVAAPLKVCFPGGAVEEAESQESAVVREMQEELGVEVQPIKCVWRWESPTGDLTLFGWVARLLIPSSVIDGSSLGSWKLDVGRWTFDSEVVSSESERSTPNVQLPTSNEERNHPTLPESRKEPRSEPGNHSDDIRAYPDPAEVAEVLWLTGDEISTHRDAMPTNKSFVAALTASGIE